MSHRKCAICDKTLEDGTKTTIVKERRLKFFVEASKKRRDGKVVLFKRNTQIEVHDKCRKQYINKKLIATYMKKSQETAESPQLSSSLPDFAFKTLFFVWRGVLRLARNHNDDFRRSIVHRVKPVNDLVAADAQYHLLCMKTLHQPP
ncbi:hypothetical protein PR048_010902 [Dryococelus australis]|uniref:Uncharacterized protein n=1 Tax=Dryococelus australis TaxID=614101 RepID=A0ABQ9I402_9NEOP|nr:hypothetical protein PR048_010902 [Dryococelus australis]